jgi:glutathionylspermidine synthase
LKTAILRTLCGKKPLLSREGVNVTMVTRAGEISAPVEYGTKNTSRFVPHYFVE